MLTFLIVMAVFSVLILVHEFGHMLMAKRMGVRVERFSLGLGKKLFGMKRKDTEYVVSLVPFGGYVKLAGENLSELKGAPEEFYSQSPFRRFLIILAGPFANYIFAFLLLAAIFAMGVPSTLPRVGKLLADYPAARIGIKEGDLVLEIDGKKIEYWDELVNIVHQDIEGAPLNFKVARDERILDFEITPKVISIKNIFGQEIPIIAIVGIVPEEEIIIVKHGISKALPLAYQRLAGLTALTYKGLWLLVTGGVSAKEALGGPLEIGFRISAAAKAGLAPLFYMMALINVALFIFNLLPIPILDGGHILFLAIEKIRGRPFSQRTQEIATQIAFYILITLFLLVTWNDISRRWDDIVKFTNFSFPRNEKRGHLWLRGGERE